MIPFSRLVIYGTERRDSNVLNVDFRLQTVGSTECIDQVGNVFSPVGTSGAASVVSTELGNAMRFNGTSYFRTPMVDDLKLSQQDFRLNVKFRSTSAAEQIVFMTGDYYTVPTIKGGFEIILNNNLGTQVFALDNVGNFSRLVFVLNSGWNDVQIDYHHSTKVMTVLNKTNNSTNTATLLNGIGDGDYFAIGASYTRTSGSNVVGGLIGDILYLTVELL